MPLDPSVRRFLDLLAAGGGGELAQPGIRRENFRSLMQMAGSRAPSEVNAVNRAVAGPGGPIRLRFYRQVDARDGALPTLFFVHGGGFIAGDLETHDGVCRHLCAASGWQIVAVEYRLAPEHRFPAALDDAAAALKALTTTPERWKIDIQQFAIGGDSVGAGMVAALCQRSRGAFPILAQVLICPVLDLAGDYPSRREFADGFYLEARTLADDLQNYLSVGDRLDDPRLSPARVADVSGLPPTFIHAAEYDPFRDEALAYAERLKSAGVTVETVMHPGMIHLFYGLSRLIPHGRVALAEIGARLKRIARPALVYTADAKLA